MAEGTLQAAVRYLVEKGVDLGAADEEGCTYVPTVGSGSATDCG